MNAAFLNAQTVQNKKQPLINILEILSNTYNVRFSYIDNLIRNKKSILPNRKLSLEDALKMLKNQTQLDFELLDNGFIAIKKTIKDRTSFKIQNLEKIVITNYLTTGIAKLSDGSLTIKPESFGILPGLIEPDILQTIQAIPGVLSTDETVSNINVRGGTHDQNLLLWDGIKMYQSGHFFGLISAFNPHTTQRINVYKNGSRAKYGDGVSSVIDMQLPNNVNHNFSGGLGLNFINFDGHAKIPISKKIGLQFSTRRSITDLINTTTYDQYFKRIFQDSDFTESENSISQNERFYFYDITTKLLYDISKKDKLRFHFLNVNNTLNYDEQSTINDQNEALNSKLSQRNTATGITYTRDWNNKFTTTSQVYLSNYNLDAINFDILNNQRLIQKNEVLDITAKLDIDYAISNQIKLNGGYQFTEVGISNLENVNNPVFRRFIKEVIKSHAIYAEALLLPNNATTKLNIGSRLNYIEKLDLLFLEPRLSFSQRFFNHFRFDILGEYKSQTTSQIIDLQNDFLGIEKRRWVLANNGTIPVIKSKQVSAGLHYNQNKLLISTEAYIKKVDGITTRSQGFQNQFQFINSTGSYTIKGLDFLVNKQFNNTLSSWISYSYSTNNYLFDNLNNGKAFPNNVDINHALTLAGTYTNRNLKIALGLNWHSGKPTTEPIFNSPNNDRQINYLSPNAEKLKDYVRTDYSVTYKFNLSGNTRATVGASVWNALSRRNIINTYYNLDNENQINKIENESLGITTNLSFRVNF
ncbi:TonB-dependent receptor plug domain-containing protein [uncultured Algibacter sp.]|uniref:TonB-dependent receptor plug domain-containing protein n=1 Tax=uncultured Algibacter sp. TaxID=298659 RepID=UPI003216C9BE